MCDTGRENVRYSKKENDGIVINVVNADLAKFCFIWKLNNFYPKRSSSWIELCNYYSRSSLETEDVCMSYYDIHIPTIRENLSYSRQMHSELD